MLKDNHIDYAGGIVQAINKAHAYLQDKALSLKIEVETRTLDDVQTVCSMGKDKVFRIMLDNFSPKQITEALPFIPDNFETEASGGINELNLLAYAKTGVNFISMGALTHQVRSLDLSLKAC